MIVIIKTVDSFNIIWVSVTAGLWRAVNSPDTDLLNCIAQVFLTDDLHFFFSFSKNLNKHL